MSAPVTSLELSTATRLQRVERLQGLGDEALRRHAVKAANERDIEALWDLVEAHLTLHGGSGVATSAHTMRAYRRGVADLVTLWEGENLLRPRRDAGTLYVQRLRSGDREPLTEREPPRGRRGRRVKRGPLAPATVQLKVAAARALYDALAWAGATDADPFRDVRMGRQTTRAEDVQAARSYTDFELIEMLHAARDQQERVILLLGAHGGLRVSEMLRLRWDEVDLARRDLLVTDGKGGKSALVALTPKLAEALLTYRRAREAGGTRRATRARASLPVRRVPPAPASVRARGGRLQGRACPASLGRHASVPPDRRPRPGAGPPAPRDARHGAPLRQVRPPAPAPEPGRWE